MKGIIKALILCGLLVTTIASAYEICAPGESGTFHRDYSTCRSYIACSEGKSYKDECPKEFFFNPEKSSCDFPQNVKCDQSCPTSGTTAFTLGRSCLKYIQCKNGKATYEECRPGTIFDNRSKSCQPRERAHCQYGGKCPDPRADYSWASEDKCAGYFSCKKGKYSVNECPNGLHYNAARERCDTPAIAKCPIVTVKVVEMGDIEIVCPKNGSHFLPHMLDCAKYYVCYNGKSSLMSCVSGLKYDYLRQVCDVSNKSKCVVDVLAQPPVEVAATFKANGTASANTNKAATTNAALPTVLVADEKKDDKKKSKRN